MKTLVIVAPTVNALTLETVRRCFAATGLAVEMVEARAGDPISEIVQGRLGEGFGSVVAVGGDGTVAAVAHAGDGEPLNHAGPR